MHDEVFQIDINCFNRFRFLGEFSKKFPKNALFFGNLGTVTQEGKKESRQMTPYFHLIFEL